MAKTLSARVIHMHDVEANWNKLPTFIPKQGEVIVYDPDETHTYPRFKIGDGKTTLVNLPFGAENALDGVIQWDNDFGLIDGGKITS